MVDSCRDSSKESPAIGNSCLEMGQDPFDQDSLAENLAILRPFSKWIVGDSSKSSVSWFIWTWLRPRPSPSSPSSSCPPPPRLLPASSSSSTVLLFGSCWWYGASTGVEFGVKAEGKWIGWSVSAWLHADALGRSSTRDRDSTNRVETAPKPFWNRTFPTQSSQSRFLLHLLRFFFFFFFFVLFCFLLQKDKKEEKKTPKKKSRKRSKQKKEKKNGKIFFSGCSDSPVVKVILNCDSKRRKKEEGRTIENKWSEEEVVAGEEDSCFRGWEGSSFFLLYLFPSAKWTVLPAPEIPAQKWSWKKRLKLPSTASRKFWWSSSNNNNTSNSSSNSSSNSNSSSSSSSSSDISIHAIMLICVALFSLSFTR